MNKSKKIGVRGFATILCLLSGLTATFAYTTLAWLSYTNTTVDPSFNGSVVKSYFDEESTSSVSDGVTTYTYIITRPVHLYNLAYLTDTGNLTENSTTKFIFQLGKQVNGTGDYLVYESSSSSSLNSSVLDMSTSSAYQEIPPIGTSTYPFASIFTGNSITISNLVVKDTVFSNDTTHMTDIGLFGYIGDGVSLKNFNLDKTVVNLAGTSQNVGIVVGYVNQSSAGTVTVNGIGVRNGTVKGKATFSSGYSLIGNGTERGLATITNNNENYSSGNEYGVMFADEMYSKLQNSDTTIANNFTFYSGSYYASNQYAWVGSSGTSSFGIFNLAANTETAGNSSVALGSFGSASTIDFYDFSSEFEAEYNTPTLDVTKKLSAPIINGSEIVKNDSTRKSSVTLGDGSTKAKLFLNSSGKEITNSTYTLAFPNKASYSNTMTAKDYANNNKTAVKYQNSLFFHITNPTGGLINFIASVPGNKAKSKRSVGIWKLDETSEAASGETKTADGIIHGDEPNLFRYFLTNGTITTTSGPDIYCGFSFHLAAGSYMISSSQNGLYFNYIAVGGQSSGTTGTPTGNGISLDYIKDVSEDVSSTSYVFSQVTFAIAYDGTDDFSFYFSRSLDENNGDTSSMVNLLYEPASASSSITIVGTSSKATLTNSAPPS